MTIAAGDRIPDATLRTMTEEGAKTLSADEIFKGKTVVLFGVPGAFTGTCTNQHVPGYLENHDALVHRGVDTIAVVSVNDHHVMAAWEKFTNGNGKLLYLADGNGEFVRALGLDVDLSGGGLGVRSKRFSMLVRDGVVEQVNIEESPGKAEASGAARMLEQLGA